MHLATRTVLALLIAGSFVGLYGQTEKVTHPPGETRSQENQKQDPSTTIAVVGDTVITLRDLENRISQTMPQFRARFATLEGRKSLLNSMIESRLLYDEGVRRGIHDDPVIKDRIQAFAEQLIGGELSRRILDGTQISDQEAETYYTAHPDEFTTPEQIRVRHILFKSKDAAETTLDEIRKGANFEELATARSEDSRTAPSGGELGWIRRGMVAPEFEDVAFPMSPGAISKVVGSRLGFHIIQLIDRRPAELNPFSVVKLRIRNQLRGERQRVIYEEFKEELRQQNRIVIYENLLEPADHTLRETTSRKP